MHPCRQVPTLLSEGRNQKMSEANVKKAITRSLSILFSSIVALNDLTASHTQIRHQRLLVSRNINRRISSEVIILHVDIPSMCPFVSYHDTTPTRLAMSNAIHIHIANPPPSSPKGPPWNLEGTPPTLQVG
jgi:hypothetical protein